MSSNELVKMLNALSDSFYILPFWDMAKPFIYGTITLIAICAYIGMEWWSFNTKKKLYKIYDQN